jgi:uncharacterized protein DUF6174
MPIALLRLRGSVARGSLAVLALACSNPAAPTSVQSILAHRAVWVGQGLTNYSYTYQFHAFNAFADQPLRLEVRQDTVRSVVVLATGQSISPAYFPTIDALFDRALGTAQNGSLTRIAFDAVRGYPTLLAYAAVPDALSSQQASALQPLQ